MFLISPDTIYDTYVFLIIVYYIYYKPLTSFSLKNAQIAYNIQFLEAANRTNDKIKLWTEEIMSTWFPFLNNCLGYEEEDDDDGIG